MEFTYLPIDEYSQKVGLKAFAYAMKNEFFSGLSEENEEEFTARLTKNASLATQVVMIGMTILTSPNYTEKRSIYLLAYKDSQDLITHLLTQVEVDRSHDDVLTTLISSILYSGVAQAMLDLQKEYILIDSEKLHNERSKPFEGTAAEPTGDYDVRN